MNSTNYNYKYLKYKRKCKTVHNPKIGGVKQKQSMSDIHTDVKQLFQKLEDMYLTAGLIDKYSKKSKNKLRAYDMILNICFIYLGLRPMCLIDIYYEEEKDILLSLKDYHKSVEIVNNERLTYIPNVPYYSFYFVNLNVIKDRGLQEEYEEMITHSNKNSEKIIKRSTLGKLLGYLCPFDETEEKRHKDVSTVGTVSNTMYIYSYKIYHREGQSISSQNALLYAFVCYDNTKEYYDQAKDDLKVYQEGVSKLTDKLYIGLTYEEKIF